MRNVRRCVMAIAGAVLSLSVCAAAFAGQQKTAAQKSEEEIGIRHESLYDETKAMPARGEYSTAEPGKSRRIERAFENSPPLIPHDLTGMLPIAETNNMCLQCHMPEQAHALNATPLPRSHFVDLDTGKDLQGKLDNKRYPCMQCHVPQVTIPEPIKNTFKADFREQKDKTGSRLLETLNEGVKAE